MHTKSATACTGVGDFGLGLRVEVWMPFYYDGACAEHLRRVLRAWCDVDMAESSSNECSKP